MSDKRTIFQKNQVYPLTITSFTSEGNGVGHLEGGFAVFVPDTAPGDVIEVKLVKVLKSYAFGIVHQMVTPSADRVENDCQAGYQCGGCTYRHISYEAECRFKQEMVQNCMQRLGGFDLKAKPILGAEKQEAYRNKAQFPVGYDKNHKLIYGFYAERSHRIIPLSDRPCMIQPKEFSEIADCVIDWMQRNQITAYDEKSEKGVIRHIYLRKGEMTGEVLLCLIGTPKQCPAVFKLCEMITKRFRQVVSISYSCNPKNTNVIMGKSCETLYGTGYIKDILCGIEVRISPMAFYQVNHDQTERLYALAGEYAALHSDDLLLDLYCGIGTIGLSMAKRYDIKHLIGVEVVPQAIEDAKFNAKLNGMGAQFICDDASGMAKKLKDQGMLPDVVVLDPPRKGCDEEGLLAVTQMEPKRIIMVSCNPSTAARDCKFLCEKGYKLVEYTPVDLFPRTGHVETVILLSKGEIDSKKVRVEFSLEGMDMSGFQQGATYEQIKAYVLEKFGLKVSSLYISQIKRKCGLEVGQNYNLSKKEDAKVPQCPPEKETAIMEALKRFRMI